jgi:hypothetical protein
VATDRPVAAALREPARTVTGRATCVRFFQLQRAGACSSHAETSGALRNRVERRAGILAAVHPAIRAASEASDPALRKELGAPELVSDAASPLRLL